MQISGPPITEHGELAWHEPGLVHQVAEQEPVPDADDEARSEDERPVLERGERVGDLACVDSRALLPKVTTVRTARMPTAMKTHSTTRAIT
jgi:hypothetical protein